MATTLTPVSHELVESTTVSGIPFDERLKHVIAAGRVQLDCELARLHALGIIDEQGNLLKADLPADMRPGAERDFGDSPLTPPEMFIVAGAPGSGRSTLLPLSAFQVAFFNADDHAAKLNGGSYHAIPQSIRDLVNIDFAAFIAERIQRHESFAVETTLRTDIALLQAAQARSAGFQTRMFYIATENIAINLNRIIARAAGGGHSAPEKLFGRFTMEATQRSLWQSPA